MGLLFLAFMLLTSNRSLWRAFWLSLGGGALAASLVALLPLIPLYQWLAGLSITLTLWLLIYFLGHQPSSVAMENVLGVDRIIGQEGLVLITINPVSHGRVRVARENWRAFSDDGSTIPAGTKVQILAIAGPYVRVRPLPH